MLLIHILQLQETYNIIYSLHNLSNIENSAHFELLKYGVLQLINFLFIKPLTFHLKEKTSERSSSVIYTAKRPVGSWISK